MKNYKIFLCAIIFCVWISQIYGNECGISPSLERYSIYNSNKIISGEYSKNGDWPWIVLIESSEPGNEEEVGICTGTIIDKEWILTAAHCMTGTHNIHSIKYGSVDTDKGQKMPVKEVFIYPHYTRKHDNDIALMKLQNPLKFNENVSAICLDKNVQTFEGEIYVGAGFGNVLKEILTNDTNVNAEDSKSVEYEKDPHRFLMESPMANIGVCDDPEFNVTDSIGTICIGGVNTGPLQGDSGGPLMAIRNGKWIQLGVTSRGVLLRVDPISGRSNTLYTEVNYYYDWIQEIIGGSGNYTYP